MRYTIILILCIYAFSSCSDREDSVSLLLYNQSDPYVNIFADQIKYLGSKYFHLDIYDSQNSQIIQNEFIEKQIDKSDLMIINPVDRLGAYSIIKKLKSRDIPVVFFNREPLSEDLDLWEKAYYVGARAEQSGQIQAQMIMNLFGNNPLKLNEHDKNGNGIIETVILKGEQGHQDAEIRTSEVVKSFSANRFQLDILITEVANWNRDEAYEKMKLILENYGDSIELVISNNDAMALGAISILRQSGFFRDDNQDGKIGGDDDSWLPVVGIDGLEEAVELIDKGYLYGSVLNDSRTQAQAIVELSEILLLGGDLNSLDFPLVDGNYIWIDYKVLQ